MRRLMLVDAPAVLGAQVWGEIRQRQGLGAMRASIDTLQTYGILQGHDAERLARIVLGALYGAMDSLPADEVDISAALIDAKRCLVAMLEGLRWGYLTSIGASAIAPCEWRQPTLRQQTWPHSHRRLRFSHALRWTSP